ncbi:MAG: hypothetical protein DRJ03_22670 [Chloroflexi bacterium]|nr:MAG: hypothetical protein DRJ03_22670 [Chloroflexota bacterium]
MQTLDSLNRLDTVREGSGGLVADYDYHDLDFYSTLAYPNGLTTRTDYDTLGRTTLVSSTVAGYAYGYDAAGNRTYMQRLHRPGQPADVYQYDALYQLTQVWYGADSTDPGSIIAYDHLQWYDLDSLGNRLEVQNDGASQVYLPNDGQQLTDPMNRYETVGSSAFTYDLRGNTLSDGGNTYTYDVLNRQTGMTGPGGDAEYLYDARGRRVAKVVDGVTTHYVYDTQYRVIEERDEGGALLARYTYGSGMDEPLTMERGGQTYYYHRDALGSITEVTDASGALVERYEYDVYGAATIYDGSGITLTASAIGNPYLFTARRYDPESGNYYYRARMYSPPLGRFLSQDPLGFDAGDYNLYRYAFNNPTNLTDPSGQIVPLIAIPLIIGGGALIVDWGAQVYRNVECRGMSFWDAVHYENLNIREMAAVGVGAGAGTIAGMTVPALLPAATTFWGAVGVGTVSGSVGGGVGRITTNVILPDTAWQEGVPQAMFWGGVTGGILGGAGYGVKQWLAGRQAAMGASGRESNPYQIRYDPKSPGRPDPRWSIDTRTFSSGETTARDGIRNSIEFWKEWLKRSPEALSAANRYRIEELGLSPRIDSTWVKYFPEHANFLREVLIHHHVNQGPFAIPVPASTHIGSGGIWHTR